MIVRCKKCGKRCRHTRHKLEMPHPEGGVTVLGRRVALIPVIGYSQCSSCGHRQLLNVQLPLDEDAMLIRELFSVDPSKKDEWDLVVEWLRANKIGPDDLAELKRLKDAKTSPRYWIGGTPRDCLPLNWWRKMTLMAAKERLEASGFLGQAVTKASERDVTMFLTTDQNHPTAAE